MSKTDTPAIDPQIISALADAISKGIASSAPTRKVTFAEYKTVTPFNPKGLREHERPQFARDYRQNGYPIQLGFVTDNDVELLNKLTPGRYINGKVTVTEEFVGDGSPAKVEIHYSNKTADQRLELKNHFRNFTELLSLLVSEAELQDR